MKKICAYILLLTLPVLLINYKAYSGESRVVSLVTLANYPPYCYPKKGAVNRGREVIAPGADSDYLQGKVWQRVRSAFHSQGYTIILQVLPWKQAEEAARMGGTANGIPQKKSPKSYYDMSFDVARVNLYDSTKKNPNKVKPQRSDLLFPTIKTPEREKEFDFSHTPVNEVNMAIYVTKASGLDLSGKDSLRGKKIGIMRGWNYGKLFSSLKDYTPVEFDSIEAGFRSLRSNKVSALAGFTDIFDTELKRIGWGKFFKSFKSSKDIPEYLCGVKNAPRTRLLLHVYELSTR